MKLIPKTSYRPGNVATFTRKGDVLEIQHNNEEVALTNRMQIVQSEGEQ